MYAFTMASAMEAVSVSPASAMQAVSVGVGIVPTSEVNICIRIVAILPLFSGISLRARTFIRNVREGGHSSDLEVTVVEVWARSVQCVARDKPFQLSWQWA